jgi:serine/threonine protein kinase
MMSDSQHDRITKIFVEACELPQDQREQFVCDQAGGDEDIVSRVMEMLAADSDVTDGQLLSDQVIDAGLHFQVEHGYMGEQRPGEISRFKIIREIGRGGMGVVYEGIQLQPERPVAIKVIRNGLISSQAKQRFKREAQLLGRLQHAGIAQIYEAGSLNDEDGDQPFIAMELVDGVPIKAFCDEQNLNTKQRFQLIEKIADALHHAHQKGVIHRDLKPDNVLVVPGDSPQPKILDFGVARVSSSDSLVPITIQDHHQIIGTLDYMSPEQVSGSADVDIRTDVYALGVLAFELISGKRPFDLSGLPIVVAARVISDQEPERLSSIDTALRGDIETLISKAMSHDLEERYQSAAELSADIRRYLRGEPLLAHPPSTRYQAYKFATRNKALVCMSCVALIALVGGLVFTSIGLKQARAKTRLSDALYEFMTVNLLEQANPYLRLDGDPTIRMVLDRANEELDDQFKDDPDIELKLRETIRSAYKSLGAYEQAKAQSEKMIALAEPLYGREDNRTLRKMHGLTTDLLDLGRFEDSLQVCLEVYEIRKRKLGVNHLQTLQIMNNLGACYMRMGSYNDAAVVLEDALAGKEIVLGADDLSTINTRHNLASLKLNLGDYAEAERLLHEVIEQRANQLGDSHPRVTRSRSVLAMTYFLQEKFADCLVVSELAIESLGDRLEPDHPMRLNLELTMIRAMSGAGEHGEAWERAKEYKEVFMSEGSMYSSWLRRCGSIAHLAGDSVAAVELFDEYVRDHLESNPGTGDLEFNIDFAHALEAVGETERAIVSLERALGFLSDSSVDLATAEQLQTQINQLRDR